MTAWTPSDQENVAMVVIQRQDVHSKRLVLEGDESEEREVTRRRNASKSRESAANPVRRLRTRGKREGVNQQMIELVLRIFLVNILSLRFSTE